MWSGVSGAERPAASTRPRRWGSRSGAEAYERGRPGFPEDAIAALARECGIEPGRRVVDLAAGTGKLTRQLVPFGADLVAVEPVEGMRRVFAERLPDVPILDGTAEALPFEDGSVDAVVASQAFHWFDPVAAPREIHRVLAPGGALGPGLERPRRVGAVGRAADGAHGAVPRRHAELPERQLAAGARRERPVLAAAPCWSSATSRR